jgi:anti-anti-sigma factor
MALIKSEVKNEIRVVFVDVASLVDGAVIDQSYREIVDLLEKTEESNVLLHFGRVGFMSSSALGMLIRVQKRCKEYGVDLKLCNISAEIGEVFKITGLNKVFDIRADAAAAIEAVKASGRLVFRKKKPPAYEVT